MLITKITSFTFYLQLIAFKDCQEPVTAFVWVIPNFSWLQAQRACFSFTFTLAEQPAFRLCGWVWLASSHRKQIICKLELRPALLNGSQNVHLAWSWDLCCLSQISRETARVSSVGWMPGRLWKLWASVEASFRPGFQRHRLSKVEALRTENLM